MNPKNMPNAKPRIMNNMCLPSSGSNITELSTDIIAEIFLKLSTKDLLCSMCVCRSWYNLIANPNFTSSYRRNSRFTTVVLSQHSPPFRDFFLLEIASDGEFIRRPINPKLPRPVKGKSNLSIIGLLDGLLFLLLRTLHDCGNEHDTKEEVYICNPLFGGCSKLGNDIVTDSFRPPQYKLGFAPSTKKFKLLRTGFLDDGRSEAHIFSVGEDNKWRSLEVPSSLLSRRIEGCYFNGAYHYLVKDEIYTFDFGREKGGRILKQPSLLEKCSPRRLTTLGNRLCVVECSVNAEEMIVWAMEDDGVSLSWTRTTLLRSWFQSNISFPLRLPLEVLQNGDFLFVDVSGSKLFCFNRETKKCSEIKASDGDSDSFPHEFIAYAVVNTPRFYSIRRNAMQGQ